MRRNAMRFLVFAVVAAFGVICFLPLRGASPQPNRSPLPNNSPAGDEAKEPVRVLKVISGDTVQIVYKGNVETVRLKGLDVSGKDTWRAAEDARRLARLLRGKSVQIDASSFSEEARDDEGRLLVTLYAEGENINRMLRPAEPVGGTAEIETVPDEPELPEARSGSPSSPPPKKKNGPNVIAKVTYNRVYVTPRDRTYHKANCRLLSGIRAVPVLKEYAIGQGYKPCRRCKP